MRNPAEDSGVEPKTSEASSSSSDSLKTMTTRRKNATKGVEVRDRTELMERIKRGESPTWIPSKAVGRTLSDIVFLKGRFLFNVVKMEFWRVHSLFSASQNAVKLFLYA